ncbi:hypothetical protein A1O3_04891 [Capronia epimyces CBS 606.96]|uniref:Fungal N-terminal domain-containing protein n=1 Tax=Capronia epimyces CBS 606.96 TaxID=1182542 RepID=W9YPN2_9EURO|nr:uncharacterized protein A1O3_04891 [Capronia epimyces CBS 606.96]EXJ84224.1 hypothetical protein A1O3_04891 [Capronia epimyces CBS 606.96]
MATGLDVGVAAVTLFQASHQLVKLCNRSYQSFKCSSRKVKRLKTSVSTFSSVLDFFHKTMTDLDRQGLAISKDLKARKLLYDLTKQIQEAVHDIKAAFQRLGPLHDPSFSPLARVWAKMLWMFMDEQDLKELLARLEPMKLSILIFSFTFNLHLQMAIMDELRRLGQATVDKEREIKHLKKRIKLLERECEEAQRDYEASRAVKVVNNSAAFHGQATQDQMIRALVERIEKFANEQVSASKAIMTELRRGTEATTTTTGTSNTSDSHTPQPGTEGPPSPLTQTAVPRVELNEYLLRPRTGEQEASLGQECMVIYQGTSHEQETSLEEECMFVIHDDGTLITEEWRRPRVPARSGDDTDSVISRHSAAGRSH